MRSWMQGFALVTVVVVPLVGCSASAPVEEEAVTPQSTQLAPDELYLETVRSTGYVDGETDEDLLAAGTETCAALDRGVDPIEVLALASEISKEAGTVVFGTAVPILCREHLEVVQELAESLS